MSRHLMARFRQFHASPLDINWQHGVPSPRIKESWETPPNGRGEDWKSIRELPIDYSDHAMAVVNHGEQNHILAVYPAFIPELDQPNWRWAMDKQVGEDFNNPDHWKLRLGPHRDQVDYMGDAYSREEALRGAEDAWRRHVELTDAQNPLRGDNYGPGQTSQHSPLDDDFGDIFGEREARLRTAALEWTPHTALPHTKEWRDEAKQEILDDPDDLHNPDQYDTTRNSVAFVQHGEQRYGLETMPFEPWLDSPELHSWTIQKQIGPDITDRNHWGYYFHLVKDFGPNSENPSGANYSGAAKTIEQAQADAEENMQKHIDFLNSRSALNNYDYDHDHRKPLDDDFGDIFGSGS